MGERKDGSKYQGVVKGGEFPRRFYPGIFYVLFSHPSLAMGLARKFPHKAGDAWQVGQELLLLAVVQVEFLVVDLERAADLVREQVRVFFFHQLDDLVEFGDGAFSGGGKLRDLESLGPEAPGDLLDGAGRAVVRPGDLGRGHGAVQVVDDHSHQIDVDALGAGVPAPDNVASDERVFLLLLRDLVAGELPVLGSVLVHRPLGV